MEILLTYIVPLLMIAVLLVLCAGLWNMFKGTSPSRSQNLMRWRVGLQFVAIILLMVGLYYSGQ
ncbi:MAG: hypothetical protein ACJAXQ_000784 [Parvibaculaceae bacterium]|jgi:hypothetical protein|nr:twin transmembrane helix small protein [Parvibaculaceae bacterium]